MNITNFLQKGLMTFTFMIIPMTLIKHFDWQNVRVMESLSSSYDFGIVAMGPALLS